MKQCDVASCKGSPIFLCDTLSKDLSRLGVLLLLFVLICLTSGKTGKRTALNISLVQPGTINYLCFLDYTFQHPVSFTVMPISCQAVSDHCP